MFESLAKGYDNKARIYADVALNKPINALYERVNSRSLVYDVEGLRILDAGCGPGWNARYFLEQGAQSVTAVDSSGEMVEVAREFLGKDAEISCTDLNDPLPFADEGFDLIYSALVVHYFRDLKSSFAEFARVLKPGGALVFSTHHPFRDSEIFGGDYHEERLITDDWRDLGEVKFFKRPLCAYTEALHSAGFVLERLLEPSPSEALKKADPRVYGLLTKHPGFLFIRARLAPFTDCVI